MQITICGCGWLGAAAALELVSRGHSVVGTKQNPDHLSYLVENKIEAIPFRLNSALSPQNLEKLASSDAVMLNIPCGRRRESHAQYIEGMESLLQTLHTSNVKHILHISTTSVYGGLAGRITSTDKVAPVSLSAKTNYQLEQSIQSLTGDHTILRLAGLVGGDRHPARQLSGRTGLPHPNAPVNLVHRTDVVNTIIAIIEKQKWGQVFHLSCKDNPSRADYYRYACKQMKLVPPTFSGELDSAQRTIDATRTLDELGVDLKFASPFDMLCTL